MSSTSSSPNDAKKPRESDAGRTLLDASALLAAIFEETGAGPVRQALNRGAVLSSVNASEVVARLQEDGWTAAETSGILVEMGLDIVPFDWETAFLTGLYRSATRRFGLGLGDRACLATGRRLGLPVLTADRAWTKLNLRGVTIRCIR